MSEAASIPMRACTRCKQPFLATLEHFPSHKMGKYGLHSNCRSCKKLSDAEKRARPDQKERQQAWRDANKGTVKEYNQAYRAAGYKSTQHVAEWRAKNMEHAREYARAKARRVRAADPAKYLRIARNYYYRNHAKVLQRARDYLDRNRETINAKALERHTRFYRERPEFNLQKKIGARLRRMIQDKAGAATMVILGYSREELVAHIERQFTKGMSWAKVLAGEIHIDHIIPVSHFQCRSIHDPGFKACWALSNLRPLWAKDNLSKQDKILTLL
ncbi:hypothetical protein [Herbaspirillum sp. SJZ107]|uniref:hypothetical protein n=1 Tax=Herbaspirillum sp. SJZ107 TaxID=2572881 RepID=UPI00114F3984|nr:hypothetical protein [Herbaspirillum sp. SJZ107]TQK10236.1 hypothetical protein FBX97_0152 [Herbaspirillum sp. SJZ107]